MYAAIFLGFTFVQLRSQVLSLPWFSRSLPDPLTILPRIELPHVREAAPAKVRTAPR